MASEPESVRSRDPRPSTPPSSPFSRMAVRNLQATPPPAIRNLETAPATPYMVSPIHQTFSPSAVRNPQNTHDGDRCFKCKQEGHWMKDCPQRCGQAPASPAGGGPSSPAASNLPEFQCRCGALCVAQMSRTEKNPNKWFFSCSSCKYFTWCEKVLRADQMQQILSPVTSNEHYGPHTPKTPKQKNCYRSQVRLEAAFDASSTSPYRRQTVASSSDYPELQCKCGAGACFVRLPRTAKNPNRWFYCCDSCKYFEWCDIYVARAGQMQASDSPGTPEQNNLPKAKQTYAECLTSPMRRTQVLNTCSQAEGNQILVTNNTDGGGVLKNPMQLDQNYNVASVSCPECPCGAGRCRISVMMDGKNAGWKYYSCPIKKGQGACNFFQWLHNPEESDETKNHLVKQHELPSFNLLPEDKGVPGRDNRVNEVGNGNDIGQTSRTERMVPSPQFGDPTLAVLEMGF